MFKFFRISKVIKIQFILCIFLLSIFNFSLAEEKKVPFTPNDNLKSIREKIKQNDYSFTVKDYTAELGKNFFKPGRHAPKLMQKWYAKIPAKPLEVKTDLPKKFDWRNVDGKAYIGPVRNQGNLGSCFTFGSLAAAESLFNIAASRYDGNCVNFAEGYLGWVLGGLSPYSGHFSADSGSDWDYYELTAITRLGMGTGFEGVCFENDFPYTEIIPAEDLITKSYHYPRITFDGWYRIYPPDYKNTTDAIKTAIMQNGAVVASVLVSGAFDSYEKGIYEDTFTEPTTNPYFYYDSDHEISLVGWDDNPPEGGDGCWILRNSWGESWGEKGYMRIRYGSAGVNLATCYITYDPSSEFAMTSQVNSATHTAAVVSGYIKAPRNTPVSYYFEYGEEDNLSEKTDIVPLKEKDNQLIYEVTAALQKLKPGAVYSYRLKIVGEKESQEGNVENPSQGGSYANAIQKAIATGKIQQFILSKPDIESSGVISNRNCLEIKVEGKVVPHDIPATVYVEYGETKSLGSSTPSLCYTRDAGLSFTLDDLKPASTYFYRLVADNGTGVSRTAIESVTTPDFIFYDGFETFDSSEGNVEGLAWNQKYLLSGEEIEKLSYYWALDVSGISIPKQTPNEPFSGDANARFSFYGQNFNLKDYNEETGGLGRMFTNPLNLGYFSQAYLSFYYAQPAWDGTQDILKVYYKNVKDGEWLLIPGTEYNNEVRQWKKQTLSLPDLSKTYQIMFEGTGNFGWGIVIDEVKITPNAEETGASDWALY